jgi:hypothetical protein
VMEPTLGASLLASSCATAYGGCSSLGLTCSWGDRPLPATPWLRPNLDGPCVVALHNGVAAARLAGQRLPMLWLPSPTRPKVGAASLP